MRSAIALAAIEYAQSMAPDVNAGVLLLIFLLLAFTQDIMWFFKE